MALDPQPSLFSAAARPSGAVAPRPLSLTRLAGEIARSVGAIGKILVEGEVHRPSRTAGGRVYFTLRDRAAQISVSVPAGRQRYCRVVAGERVAVTGSVMWQPDRGSIQFEASEVVPVGAGAVAAAIAEARARLAADGLLTRARRDIPLLPRVIGVVCGNEAAVRRDIESIVAVRAPGYPVQFLEVAVQGAGAIDQLTWALQELDRRVDVDVIVLARGGGDPAQLLPFSDEGLCRAICASTTPVVSAIGHENDRPLSDEVADWRAGTPSIAAARVVPDLAALHLKVEDLRCRAAAVAERRIERARHRLGAAAWQGALDRRVEAMSRRLERIAWRSTVPQRIERSAWRLDALLHQAEVLSPQRVLERGYAVVRTGNGLVVRSASEVSPREGLTVTVAEGSFSVVVSS